MEETKDVREAEMGEETVGTHGEIPEEAGVEYTAAESASCEEESGTALSPIREFTKNEGVEQRPNLSLREILGGDILTNGWLKRQMGLIVLCAFFAIIYITNRYSSEQEIIEIEKLKTELTDMRYRALTRSSELTVKTRQSQVEQSLKMTGDSVLESPKEPPYIIKSNRREE